MLSNVPLTIRVIGTALALANLTIALLARTDWITGMLTIGQVSIPFSWIGAFAFAGGGGFVGVWICVEIVLWWRRDIALFAALLPQVQSILTKLESLKRAEGEVGFLPYPEDAIADLLCQLAALGVYPPSQRPAASHEAQRIFGLLRQFMRQRDLKGARRSWPKSAQAATVAPSI